MKRLLQIWFKKIRQLLPHIQYLQTPQILASRYQKTDGKYFRSSMNIYKGVNYAKKSI